MKFSNQVRIAVIGAGNRAQKYLEYARRNPDRLRLVAVADVNSLRCRTMAGGSGLPEKYCYNDYDDFFAAGIKADMVLVTTPDHCHFDPVVKAIRKGYHVLLEKPIAQHPEECREIQRLARKYGVRVGACHILRYHPYFRKLKELVDSGRYGRLVSVSHSEAVGIDRATHCYVRGIFRREQDANPILLAKCCHDIDFLLWLMQSPCRKLSSFGSLKWFRKENAPEGSAERCVECPREQDCPYSAKNLYYVRKEWISNFDRPDNMSMDEVILRELKTGPYGRCVFRCDNDVADHQTLILETENGATATFTIDMFTIDDHRRTTIHMTEGEICGDEQKIIVHRFRGGDEVFDFTGEAGQPFHAGADLRLIGDFIDAVQDPSRPLGCSIDELIESHIVCFEAEKSRRLPEYKKRATRIMETAHEKIKEKIWNL